MSVKLLARLVALLIFGSIVGYIVYANTTPHTVVSHYEEGSRAISKLSPQTRLEYIKDDDLEFARVTARPVYFTVRARLHYDSAEVRIVYRNKDPKQYVRLGYRNDRDWSYAVETLTPSRTVDGWIETRKTFQLKHGHYQKGTLGWILEITGNSGEIKPVDIKSIEVTLTKKGWADD